MGWLFSLYGNSRRRRTLHTYVHTYVAQAVTELHRSALCNVCVWGKVNLSEFYLCSLSECVFFTCVGRQVVYMSAQPTSTQSEAEQYTVDEHPHMYRHVTPHTQVKQTHTPMGKHMSLLHMQSRLQTKQGSFKKPRREAVTATPWPTWVKHH